MNGNEKSPEIAGQEKNANHEGQVRFLLPHTMETLYIGGRFHDTSRVLDVILGLHGLSVDMLRNCEGFLNSAEYREKQASIMRCVKDFRSDSLDERRTKGYLRRELDQLLWGIDSLVDRQANYEAGNHSNLDFFS
ncbi:hypothetical protein A1D25_05005 [Ursidibacter arcticus]|uniref:hypothetical protein n=1 Tax=Ursidibacter arcticus TaxID=1524965 RepID=UPI0012FAE6EC|nr:hypothetical protein [Ursidibacter arcticus]KAE9535306.1 hypothetical protein A1D25_05005 [Ursidibacter arcticus]